MLDVDGRLALGHQHRPLEDVLDLPDVAGPGVGQKPFVGVHGERRRSIRRFRLEIVVQQGEQIDPILLAPVPDRRHGHRHHAQPVEEILPESLRLDILRQAPPGGHHDPGVDADVVTPADAPEGPGLEDPQQLGLDFRRHVADLADQDRTAVSELDQSAAALGGIDEDAPLLPEQQGFERRRVHSGATDLEEGLLPAGAEIVNRPGDPGFAGAGFAGQQERGPVALGEEAHLLGQLAHRRRGSERVEPFLRRRGGEQGRDNSAGPAGRRDPGRHREEHLDVGTGVDHLKGAGLEAAGSRCRVRPVGEQDDRRLAGA